MMVLSTSINTWQFLDGTQRLSITTEYSFEPSTRPIQFSWWQGNADFDMPLQVAVRVGGTWYASTARIRNPDVSSDADFRSGAGVRVFNYNPAAANWLVLNFTGDYDPVTNTATPSTGNITLGSTPAANLAGPITGFGFYRDVTGANARFDSVRVAAIPEPSSCAVAALALICLARRRRSPRRRFLHSDVLP